MPNRPQEQLADLPFPVSGIDVSTALTQQRPATTPGGANVRTFEPISQRGRGGSRPGLAPYILPQLPSGAHLIQNLNTVDPTEEGGLLDWSLAWAPNAFAPDGFTLDTSTAGSQQDWGAVPVSFGLNSRIPLRLIRVGGSGIQLNKNISRPLTVPTINWANPADVTPGTALSGTQLNATATDPNTSAIVPGSYVYTPANGTVLAAGNAQPLYVLFTPADQSAYTINAKTVHINAVAPGFSFIQTSDFFGSGGTNQHPVWASPGSVTSGHLLVVCTMVYVRGGTAFSTSATTDDLGNVYVKGASLAVDATDHGGANAGKMEIAVWWCVSAFSGACNPTSALNADPTGSALVLSSCALEYSGNAASPADGSGSGTAGDGSPSTGSMAVSGLGELALGFLVALDQDTNPSLTPSGGATERTTFSPNSVGHVADLLSAAPASAVIAGTFSVAGWAAAGMAFKHS